MVLMFLRTLLCEKPTAACHVAVTTDRSQQESRHRTTTTEQTRQRCGGLRGFGPVESVLGEAVAADVVEASRSERRGVVDV